MRAAGSAAARRLHRWIAGLACVDRAGRPHPLNAWLWEETSPAGEVPPFAGRTDLPLNRQTVLAVAHPGGGLRSPSKTKAATSGRTAA